MRRTRWLWLVLMVGTLLLAACGGRAAPAAEATEPAVTEETLPKATATAAPTEEPTEVPTEEPTEEPEEEPTEPATGLNPGSIQRGDLSQLEEVDSFRMRMEISAEGEAFEEGDSPFMGGGVFLIEMAFTREPLAQHVSLSVETDDPENSPLMGFESLEVIQVGDTAYTNFGSGWVQTPAEEAIDASDFTFISPDDFVDDMEDLEEVGVEEVNGRPALHLRGDRDLIAAMNADDGEFNLDDVDEAQIDLWIDQELNVVTRMELVAAGRGLNEEAPDADGRMTILLEYYDINEPFTIEPPEDSGADLGSILGFDLELPEGAEMGLAMPGLIQFTLPLPLDDARTFLEEAMAAGGLTLDADSSVPDFGLFVYTTADGSNITVQMYEEDGATNVVITTETE